MKLVLQVLAKKNVTIEQLPPELQKEVNSLRELVDKYNEAFDEYEKVDFNQETEKNLREKEDYVVEADKLLAKKIEKTIPNPKGGKKNYLGWIIAGIVLVGTMGVVNFKNK